VSDEQETPGDEKAVPDQIEAMKQKVKEALDEAKAAKRALKQYDGIDPKEYRALLDERELAEADQAKVAGDWEKREETWKKKVSEKDAIIADQDTRFRGALRERDAALAIGHHKGSEKLLLPVVLGNLKVDEEYKVYAEGPGGERLSPDEYVAQLAAHEDYAPAFSGTGAGGAGSKPATVTPGGNKLPTGVEYIS